VVSTPVVEGNRPRKDWEENTQVENTYHTGFGTGNERVRGDPSNWK